MELNFISKEMSVFFLKYFIEFITSSIYSVAWVDYYRFIFNFLYFSQFLWYLVFCIWWKYFLKMEWSENDGNSDVSTIDMQN